MGLRFRRTFKIMPGVRLNVTKTGVSTTIGPRGAHTTISSRRVTNTVDIPGSGLSYSETSAVRPAPSAPARKSRGLVACVGLVLIASSALLYLDAAPFAGVLILFVSGCVCLARALR
jgi:hypothetical protein